MSNTLPKTLITRDDPPISSRERRFSRYLLFLEDIVKKPAFNCQECGECILSSTAFVCSQNCPKKLRNGPCGGTGANGSCEVYPERRCVWHKTFFYAKSLKRFSALFEYKKIHNWNLEHTSSWLNVIKKRIDAPIWKDGHDQEKLEDIFGHDSA